MSRPATIVVVGLVLLMAACKPGTPSQYIQPDDMEDILVDYYLACALAQEEWMGAEQRDYTQALYFEAVMRRHGVTQQLFDSSLVYYYTRADRFADICEHVSQKLEERALTMGATEGEIGKYAVYNATGDTANVWPDRQAALLMPQPPYNRWDFSFDADTTYRRGDALMMQFVSDYMYQTGSKAGQIYLAAVYEDTVVSRNLRFSVSGVSQLRLPEDTTRVIKAVKGFFYLGRGTEPTSTTRLLFLSNVQLVRFHTKPLDELPADSVPRDSLTAPLPADSVARADTLAARADTLAARADRSDAAVGGRGDTAAAPRRRLDPAQP